MSSEKNFSGLTVAAFESRMSKEMTRLIERHGGRPMVAPSMQEVPLEENPQALAFGERLVRGEFDIVILLTGVGTRSLIEVLQTKFSLERAIRALKDVVLVARGPKPLAALKEFGLAAQVEVPEPNTWRDLVQAIDNQQGEGIQGRQVAIQEYGISNPDLIMAIQQRGGVVTQVPVYRWALPQDTGPLELTVSQITDGRVDVMLITNAVQVDHIVKVLEKNQQLEPFKRSLAKMIVASIGQIATERLHRHGFPIDLEPSHSKMGVLVKETSERAHDLLENKGSGSQQDADPS